MYLGTGEEGALASTMGFFEREGVACVHLGQSQVLSAETFLTLLPNTLFPFAYTTVGGVAELT